MSTAASDDPRRLTGAALAAALRDSRAVTLARTFDLPTWPVPERAGVNRIDWELGHLAWFAEFWILRGPHSTGADGRWVEAAQPARIAGPDAVFDSSRLAHADRWRTSMPSRDELAGRLEAQLDACVAAIPDAMNDASLYFHRLALFHEDMHGEAFAWLRATLGWPAPAGLPTMPVMAGGDEVVRVDAGEVDLGRTLDAPGFAFDNELPGHAVALAPFEIDAAPVCNRDFLAFVEAGGYERAEWWPGDAGRWRDAHRPAGPERWSRGRGGGWQARWFDRTLPLELDAPLVHVNAYEAEAWCRWRGRRLPSAAEWTRAALDPSCRWGGSVWEWTADAFSPYPGFAAGPYGDYSAPWFGSHRELRGGSFATHARLHDPAYRNFFTPDRRDLFAGFRSVAADTPSPSRARPID